MKELPENWCVKIYASCSNIGEKHEVIKYLNAKYKKSHDGTAYYYGVYNDDTFLVCSKYKDDPTNIKNKNNIPEISFEDFQRLVLNINVQKGYELW